MGLIGKLISDVFPSQTPNPPFSTALVKNIQVAHTSLSSGDLLVPSIINDITSCMAYSFQYSQSSDNTVDETIGQEESCTTLDAKLNDVPLIFHNGKVHFCVVDD
jgi:hypothetical protein